MYIVIVGCGHLGLHLTRASLAVGHEVLVIESESSVCQRLSDELGSVLLQGDGTDPEVLKKAGVGRSEVFVAVTSRDQDNLAACQLSKHLFNVRKTISVVRNPQNTALFELLGVDVTINLTHMVLSTIEEEVAGRPILHLMDLNDLGQEMVSINISADASVVGQRLEDLELPPNSFISLIVKHSRAVLPTSDTVLEAADSVVVVTNPDDESLLYDTLTAVE